MADRYAVLARTHDRRAGSSVRRAEASHCRNEYPALCFPELEPTARNELVRRIFESSGIGAVETAIAWFGNLQRYRQRTSIEGLDVLTAAQQRGRGVLFVGAHFATLDLAGALLSRATDLDVIYRYNKNPVIEHVMRRGRERRFSGVIERGDPRKVLTRLKEGHTVWYAADQDYGRKVSVFAPFFGVRCRDDYCDRAFRTIQRVAGDLHQPLSRPV